MIGERIVFVVLLVAFIVVGASMAWVGVRGKNDIDAVEAQIAVEKSTWDDIQQERRDLQESIEKEKERIGEMSDVPQKVKKAQAVKSSLSLAKVEGLLQNKEHRVKQRLEHLEKEFESVKGRMISTLATLCGVEVVLLVGLILVRHRLNRTRELSA